MAFTFPFLLCRCCRQCRSARHRAFSTTLCSWSPAENSSYYDLLGIKPDATLEEIKEAFFRKSKQLHPDSNLGNPGLHSEFVKLNEAYRVLRKESSRRHYDSLRRGRAAWPATGSPTGSGPPRSPFAAADFGTRSKSEPNENVRYWQQFHAAPPDSHSGPEAERELRQNQKLFGYCLLIMLGSLAVHYVGFRKLEEFHNSFMDEKDRAITQIYNESKERARSIGLQKQQELLRQKNTEFSQRYGLRHGHLPGSTGASDSVKDPAPPSSPAK
ncbi:dnaJ homolog subfamily C member 4 [Hemicordylus capensis]|uniref:dnaJ homolog subfamily C member 4 n=1 Tax=Hemicordylus capensis TaxID=884348 RepID=UPI00230289ED|nr:dnaJ homolog subfamily C member 4 [Hemicordylus capensis]XP_053134640.1 dnaJ homolog subfamily C member 4 [Hemicordylus capensis]XP_053134641.1 dnaJ homolog subfamily C member 4 [Hemicordylus capensis]